MKVLITGITGFAGSHLFDYIVANTDAEVYGIKRPRSPISNIQSPVELIDCDITDYRSVESLLIRICPDRLFHLTAQSFVPFSWQAPRLTFEVNVMGTLNVLEAIRIRSSKTSMLFAGSSEEYGFVHPQECPIKEEQPLRPLSLTYYHNFKERSGDMETPTVRCPFCRSADVEPQGKLWHCKDCMKDFEEAAVEMPAPSANQRPKKRRK